MKNKNIYLVANYTAMPKDPSQTKIAGYMKNPDNLQYDEVVYITQGLRDKDTKNSVVLDLTDEKIVKNIFEVNKTYLELFDYFYSGYTEYINECVAKLHGENG